MADDRYNRWQGLGVAQLSVAVALISGLSVAGLGIGFSLLQKEQLCLTASFKYIFAISLLLLFIAVALSCSAVITRVLDFRLTARKVRKDMRPTYNKPLTIFGFDSDFYGQATWGLFWGSCITFAVGGILLFVSIGVEYANRLH